MLENRTAVATTPTVERARSAEPSRLLRSRRTNDPFSGLSKNTATGRRVADLLRGFLRAMGDPSDAVLQANALRAAELTVAAESARAKLLAGDADADSVVRLEGMAARSVRALGLDEQRGRGPAQRETFADIAAQAQAAADQRRAIELAADEADLQGAPPDAILGDSGGPESTFNPAATMPADAAEDEDEKVAG